MSIIAYFVEANRIKTFFTFIGTKQAEFMQPDSTAMFVHKYNVRIHENWGTPEQRITTEKRTNNLGFKEDTDVFSKKENEYRILVTGDSHTDGIVRYNSESFINVWEEKLNTRDTTIFYNCLNGGVGYYTFRNYYGFLKKHKDLHPDIYLINVFTGNDFREATVFEDDRTSIPNVYRSVWMRLQRKFHSQAQKKVPRNQGLDQLHFFKYFPREKARSLQLAQYYLLKIKALCTHENIRLIVTLLPSKLDVNPAFRNEMQQLFNLGSETMAINEQLSKTLENWLAKQNIEYINLKPALQKSSEKLYLDQDLHINANAHRIIGELLYEEISPLTHVK
ncbi:SGNH/GDSL hydrolase family protein [Lacinutrix sp. Hel_I_90]|uniref:SGNH/GDSL hydrolase family protein n=1 Tax=Lacinutrix sp. Hel_I_90 TaxID=1249999 RepID=UPI0005C90BA9|nr:SGNH/GDSL hydrolase family protein [Lacinutrix sp. Hel_I_90]